MITLTTADREDYALGVGGLVGHKALASAVGFWFLLLQVIAVAASWRIVVNCLLVWTTVEAMVCGLPHHRALTPAVAA